MPEYQQQPHHRVSSLISRIPDPVGNKYVDVVQVVTFRELRERAPLINYACEREVRLVNGDQSDFHLLSRSLENFVFIFFREGT